MKIIKNILAGIGLLFVLVAALGAFTSFSRSNFEERNRAFSELFVRDLSAAWRIEDVQDRLTNEFLVDLAVPETRKAFRVLAGWGQLKEIADVELLKHQFGKEGETGAFRFKANFENGNAIVVLTVHANEERARVADLDVIRVRGVVN